MNNILVSVIIPFYKDWARLSLCINALSAQTFPAQKFEIILVNNNPQDTAPADLVLPLNAKLIVEEKPGAYAARNAGLKIAAGDIMGFTDSDCIPDKNWIKYAVEYFHNNAECSRIAGKVAVFRRPESTRIELYDTLYAFNQKGYVSGSGTSVTANLFAYRYVFNEVGYFDETLMSGGDFYWGTLAHKKGYKVDYVENIIVNHPARDTLKELVKKEKRVGGSQARFLTDNGGTLHNFLQFLKALKPRRSEIRHINSRGKELTPINKIYLVMLRHYLLGVRAYAKLSVQMGKKPNRV